MKKVLVAGATGYLGRYMVKALKQQGYWVRVLVRNPKAIKRAGSHGSPKIEPYIDDVFKGEVTKRDSLGGLCEDIDHVFSSVGITRQREGMSYLDVDYQGNLNLLREAEAANVKQFMYVAVFKGDQISGMLNETKELFVKELKRSEVKSIIVRPTGYYSDMEEFLKMAQKGKVNLIGDGNRRMNPIHGADLADFCVEKLSAGEEELHVGGPEVFTHRDIASLAFQATQNPERISKIPAWVFKTGITPLKWLSPNSYGPVEFLYGALTNDMVAPAYGSRDLLTHFKKVVERRR